MTKLNTIEKGRINKSRLADYIYNLEAKNEKFPINNLGEVNLTEVAKICGFNRQVFFANAGIREQLNSAIERIGKSFDGLPANNTSRLADYIHNLEVKKEKFPKNNFGKVNLSKVAKVCGFNRQVFFANAGIRAQLNSAIERIEKSFDEPPAKNSPTLKTAKEVEKLGKSLDVKNAEIAFLKTEIEQLKKIIVDLESGGSVLLNVFDELLLTGRRFHL